MEPSWNRQPILSGSSRTVCDEQSTSNMCTDYPKGINPFGDSTSSDEEQIESTESPKKCVNGNPFGDSDGDSDIGSYTDSTTSDKIHSKSPSYVGKRPAPKPPIVKTTVPETFSSYTECKNSSQFRFLSNEKLEISEPCSIFEITPSASDISRREMSYNPSSLSRTSSEHNLSPPSGADLYNENGASNPPKKFSVSCEDSLHKIRSYYSKGPAPPLPPTGRRLIRTECESSFVEYRQLRKDIEDLSDKLSHFDSVFNETEQKMNLADKDSKKYKKYAKVRNRILSKRSAVQVRQKELQNQLQRQLLEERHADLEFELRNILSKQEHLRTLEERQREQVLLNLLVEIVEERANLTEFSPSTSEMTPAVSASTPRSTSDNGQPRTFF